MTTLRHVVVGITLLSILAVAGILTTSPHAVAQPPGQGQGVVSVNIASPVPVPVRDVDVTAREPFQAGVNTSFEAGEFGSSAVVTVPAGKFLVIEHASATINVHAPEGLSAVGIWTGDNTRIDHLACLPTGKTTNDLNHFFACSAQTKFYAGPGETVRVFVYPAMDAGVSYIAFISGYYVPVP